MQCSFYFFIEKIFELFLEPSNLDSCNVECNLSIISNTLKILTTSALCKDSISFPSLSKYFNFFSESTQKLKHNVSNTSLIVFLVFI